MSKRRLHKIYKGLALGFLFFFLSLFFHSIGYNNVGKYLIYSTMVIIFYNMFNAAIFVGNSNKKFFKRVKNKQPIFTDFLTDDEDDPPFTR